MKLINLIKLSLLFLFEIWIYFPYTNIKIAEGEYKEIRKQILKDYYSKKKNVSEKRRKERRWGKVAFENVIIICFCEI